MSQKRKTADVKRERTEELAREISLQPWFLPKPLMWKIRAMLPNDYRHKMRYYFDDYGCLRCGKKSAVYGTNALCRLCGQEVMVRMRMALTRRKKPDVLSQEYKKKELKRAADARELLRDLL